MGDLDLLTGAGATTTGGLTDTGSFFFSISLFKLNVRILSGAGAASFKSKSVKLLLLWQLESGLAIGTITGDNVFSSSGSRTYLEVKSSAPAIKPD